MGHDLVVRQFRHWISSLVPLTLTVDALMTIPETLTSFETCAAPSLRNDVGLACDFMVTWMSWTSALSVRGAVIMSAACFAAASNRGKYSDGLDCSRLARSSR